MSGAARTFVSRDSSDIEPMKTALVLGLVMFLALPASAGCIGPVINGKGQVVPWTHTRTPASSRARILRLASIGTGGRNYTKCCTSRARSILLRAGCARQQLIAPTRRASLRIGSGDREHTGLRGVA